jgi:hypothetical protein
VNVVDSESQLTVLAESPRGPSVILQNHSIATQFNITNKYHKTEKVLANFVVHYSDVIFGCDGRIDKPLASVMHKHVDDADLHDTHRPKTVQKSHSGTTFSKRSNEFVQFK